MREFGAEGNTSPEALQLPDNNVVDPDVANHDFGLPFAISSDDLSGATTSGNITETPDHNHD